MTPEGELAKMLGELGYTKGDLPRWFGRKMNRKVHLQVK